MARLPLDGIHFHEDTRRYPWAATRFNAICKPCASIKAGAWRDANRDRRNATRRRRYAELKAEAGRLLQWAPEIRSWVAQREAEQKARNEAKRQRLDAKRLQMAIVRKYMPKVGKAVWFPPKPGASRRPPEAPEETHVDPVGPVDYQAALELVRARHRQS